MNHHLSLFESLSGLHQAKNTDLIKDEQTKLIAFYLPQFHRIKENSEWWGSGFTEWTNVVQGKPNFEGHYQPHIPQHFGFYDLTNIDTLREQSEVAKLFGIHGFCFYHYWFSGRRILEKPVDDFIKSNIDMNFCLCWANENWTRTWDGDDKSVLMEQKYSLGDEESFIASLAPYLKDRRYIKVKGKPLLIVYRAKELPDPKKTFNKWRALVKDYGVDDLHICAVDFYDISDPGEVGADALVEFPPHKFNGPQNHPEIMPKILNPNFAGGVVDYSKIILQSLYRDSPKFKLYRGVIPSWDNTARRQDNPTIVINATPSLYREWLSYLRAYTRQHLDEDDGFIFINAWNEWGEGCHLEPDLRWEFKYLEATYRSSFYSEEDRSQYQHKEAIKKIIEIHNLNQFLNQDSDVNQTINGLTEYKPMSIFLRSFSYRLSKFPALYRLAKWFYQRFVIVKKRI
jgi:lipopolysaccharide biosynthesis protein